jgi:hypothetical protein
MAAAGKGPLTVMTMVGACLQPMPVNTGKANKIKIDLMVANLSHI